MWLSWILCFCLLSKKKGIDLDTFRQLRYVLNCLAYFIVIVCCMRLWFIFSLKFFAMIYLNCICVWFINFHWDNYSIYFWGLLCELNELMHIKCLNNACSYLNSKGAKKDSHYYVFSSLLMYKMLLNEYNMVSLSVLMPVDVWVVSRTQYCFECSSFYTLVQVSVCRVCWPRNRIAKL